MRRAALITSLFAKRKGISSGLVRSMPTTYNGAARAGVLGRTSATPDGSRSITTARKQRASAPAPAAATT
jgi:hypothetical protein